MKIVTIQIMHGGEWHCLNRAKCNGSELARTEAAMRLMMRDWMNSQVFPADAAIRVHTE